MTLEIREAGRGDISAVCCLINDMGGHEVSHEGISERLRLLEGDPTHSLFVCERGGEVCGLLGLRILEKIEEVSRYAQVTVLTVALGERGNGIGRFMVEHAENVAAREGCESVLLTSGLWRAEAHRFYEALGYEITGYRFVKPVGR